MGRYCSVMLTLDQIITIIRDRQGTRGLREFAREVGTSASNLSAVCQKKWKPGKKLLDYLGYERIPDARYRRKGKTE